MNSCRQHFAVSVTDTVGVVVPEPGPLAAWPGILLRFCPYGLPPFAGIRSVNRCYRLTEDLSLLRCKRAILYLFLVCAERESELGFQRVVFSSRREYR